MILKAITPPVFEPVTSGEFCNHIRIDLNYAPDSTDYIGQLLKATREQCENITKRALIKQTWELVLDGFPSSVSEIIVPKPPLISVTSIKYLNEDGIETTLSSDLYTVDSDSEPGRLVPSFSNSWPSTRSVINSVRIRFVCGYQFDEFVSDVVYLKGDVCSYLGVSFECLKTTTAGVVPVVGEFWKEIEAIPSPLKQWIMINAANIYENRETVGVALNRFAMFDFTTTICDGLIENYRLHRL